MTLAPPLPDTIGTPAWMTASATKAVMAALRTRGFPGCARFVGGCVRNTLRDADVDDIDIATILTPDQVIEGLEAAGLRAVPTGVEHGTVTAISEGQPFEITTLRRDVSTDGRRATVSFTHDWSEDAQRRDFRFNAIYADEDGKLYDPTGGGIADALAGKVVFVGDPLIRIREDYLRILRYFRFLAWYGDGEPDPAALAACKALRGMLGGRSAERTAKELLKLLGAADPRPSMRLMAATGVLPAMLPFVKSLARFDSLIAIEGEQLVENDPELRLAALVPDDAATAASMAERLRLSNAMRDRLVEAMAKTPRVVSWMSPREARRAVYRMGVRVFTDRVKLGWAGANKPASASQWRSLLALAESWTPPAFPLAGDDAIQAGIAKGPKVGQALREVEEWWIDHDFPEGRDKALERLKAVAVGMD